MSDSTPPKDAVFNEQPLLRLVLATLPVGVAVVDRAGDIVLVNAASKRIWSDTIFSGRERWAQSKGFWHDSGERIAPAEWASVRALSEGETSLNELIDITTYDGQEKTIQNSSAPIRNEEGLIVGAVIVNEDVTERVRAEEALRETERLLVEAAQLGQTGSWEQNLVSGQVFNTDENRRLFFGDDRSKGARLEDYVDAVHPDDRAWVLSRREHLLAGTGPADIEYRVVWPDGSVHWIFGRATVVRDPAGRAIRVYGTNAEITERKRADEALRESATRLQYLSRRLLAVQEEERRHLSRELHDEFGQLLATITVQLHAARDLAGEAARPRLDECLTLLERAGAHVRTLAVELRPTMLDTAGLDATLRWLAQQHQQQTGIATEVVGHLHDVPAGLAIACFRVVQEALTNVVRHARAGHVWIELSRSEYALALVVRDDGVGFDVSKTLTQATREGHLGLLGMRERVERLGGSLVVDSKPGQGTRINVWLPLSDAGGGDSAAPRP